MGKAFKYGRVGQSKQLPLLDAVIQAAKEEGVTPDPATRLYGGKSWKVELISYWGGFPNLVGYPAKVSKARAIADRLEAMGICAAFDVLETGGFDVIFELQP